MDEFNGTMMQYFEWYLEPGMLWEQVSEEAVRLAQDGITAVWLPPAYKGNGGENDVGYAVYDLYDLGEFDQKGTVPTKYGTKEEYINAVNTLHDHGILVYADIVLDHMMGADEMEMVRARKYNPDNRCESLGDEREIGAWTKFTFPGRNGEYSDFVWDARCFGGIDWDDKAKEKGVFKFHGLQWEDEVDDEKGNFDYLMGADVDLSNPEVVEHLKQWGKWYLTTVPVNGFRMDAVKHMRFSFYSEWLDFLRSELNRELFSVGEYWNGDLDALRNYIDTTEGAMSLFDVPLHFRFFEAANSNGEFDMRTIFDDTLTQNNPMRSVTFVDNHDTQPGQSLESWIPDWFKPLAYALILLREAGYPCLFYGDYYGIPHDDVSPMQDMLRPLLAARRQCAYGKQNDYFDDPHIIGWTREGDEVHGNSGLAVLLTNKDGGKKNMYVGEKFAGSEFQDCTGRHTVPVTIGEDGTADFYVDGGSVSVWCKKVDPQE